MSLWSAVNRRALIGLGTNLPFEGVGGPALLAQALAALGEQGLPALAVSSAWESPAWPLGAEQPAYTNAVAEIAVGGRDPQGLFAELRAVEARFGRERRERWGPRTLDLDILDMGLVGDFAGIVLPHPRLHERIFVLLPLVEVAPGWRHPAIGETAAALLGRLSPSGGARRVGEIGRAG